MGRMKSRSIRSQQSLLNSAKAEYEKREAQAAGLRQAELKRQFLERRGA